MKDEIKHFVEKSENEKELAINELHRTEKELEELPQELEKIISDANESAVNIAKDLETKGEDELKKLEKQAQKAIRFEQKKFHENLASLTSTVAVDLARDNVVEELEKNPDLHRKFIDEALSELDRVEI